MIWDWGWNWKDIKVTGSEVAFDLSELSPKPDPGTGRYQGTAVSLAHFGRFVFRPLAVSIGLWANLHRSQ